MDQHRQHGARVKEEEAELGIWVPVKQEQNTEKRMPAVVPKVESTKQDVIASNGRKQKPEPVAVTKAQRRARQIRALKQENKQLRRELAESRDKAPAQKKKEHVTAVVTKVEPNNQTSVPSDQPKEVHEQTQQVATPTRKRKRGPRKMKPPKRVREANKLLKLEELSRLPGQETGEDLVKAVVVSGDPGTEGDMGADISQHGPRYVLAQLERSRGGMQNELEEGEQV